MMILWYNKRNVLPKGDMSSFARLAHGADPNGRHGPRHSPLRSAVGAGHIEVVRMLLDYGVAVPAGFLFGTSPLGRAYKNGHLEIVNVFTGSQASAGEGQEKVGRQGKMSLRRLC